MDGGAIVTWTSDCEGAPETVSPAFSLVPGEPGPYCSSLAVGRAALSGRLPARARRPRVFSQAWTSDHNVTAIVETTAGARVATYEGGRPATAGTFRIALGPLRARPGGVNVSVLDLVRLVVLDSQPLPVFGSLATIAYDWSPQGDWLAYATDDAVYLVRTSDWTTHVRLRVSTQGLAWR